MFKIYEVSWFTRWKYVQELWSFMFYKIKVSSRFMKFHDLQDKSLFKNYEVSWFTRLKVLSRFMKFYDLQD